MPFDFQNPPRELVVEVTQEDIAEGMRHRCFLCPVSRAVNRATGIPFMAVGTAAVPDERIQLCDPKSSTTLVEYAMPYEASNFVRDFDLGADVSPFTFTATLIRDAGQSKEEPQNATT